MEEKKRRPRMTKSDTDQPLEERFGTEDQTNESGYERKPRYDASEPDLGGGDAPRSFTPRDASFEPRRPYQPDQGQGGYERRPYQDRSQGGGYDRPYQDRNQEGQGGYERRPYQDRSQGVGGGGYERRPYQPDQGQGGYNRPYQDRNQGQQGGGYDRPYQDRNQGQQGGGYNRPYQDRNQGQQGGGYNRPYQDRSQQGGGYDRPYQDRSQQGGGYDRPYQDRSQQGGGYNRPYQDRNQGQQGGGYNRPYQDRSQQGGGYEQRPYQDRGQQGGGQQGGGYNRPYQDRSQQGGGGYGRQNQGGGGYGRQNQGGGGYGRKQGGFSNKPGKPYNKRNKDEFFVEIKPKPELPSGEGMPLNKYLAHCGLASRRKAVEFIEQGEVLVNGIAVKEPFYRFQLGDIVTCQGKEVAIQERMVYVLLNKPKGVITTTEDERGRATVMDIVDPGFPERIYPVGRLDRDTTGLILLTNDGELAQKLTHPSHHVQKQYRVGLDQGLTREDYDKIMAGMELEDGPILVNWIRFAEDHPMQDVVELEITMGRNRVVRRIFEELGYQVRRLDRFYFAGLTKKDLQRGSFRELSQREIIMLKHFTGQPIPPRQQFESEYADDQSMEGLDYAVDTDLDTPEAV